MTDPNRRTEFVAGLRAMAEFFEQHPEVNIPYCDGLNTFVYDKEELARHARATSWQKHYDKGDWFVLHKDFGGGVSFDVNISREKVCERIVTGTKIVEAQPEREEEIVEWRCSDTVLA